MKTESVSFCDFPFSFSEFPPPRRPPVPPTPPPPLPASQVSVTGQQPPRQNVVPPSPLPVQRAGARVCVCPRLPGPPGPPGPPGSPGPPGAEEAGDGEELSPSRVAEGCKCGEE